MDLTQRLEKHFNDVKTLFPSVVWFSQKNDLRDIDTSEAVLTYSTDTKFADGRPQWSMVTLTLYVSNADTHSYELSQVLGYEAISNVDIDDNYNVAGIWEKRVIVV